MNIDTRRLIEDLLRSHNVLSLATIRPDGYPQATTVAYVNDGLTIYIGIGDDSQKLRNIRLCDKVSLTIDRDEPDWRRIRGLSMAATAAQVTDPVEIAHIGDLMVAKFPQLQHLPKTDLEGLALLRIMPSVISVLDYTKGFGHTEQVEV